MVVGGFGSPLGRLFGDAAMMTGPQGWEVRGQEGGGGGGGTAANPCLCLASGGASALPYHGAFADKHFVVVTAFGSCTAGPAAFGGGLCSFLVTRQP